MKLIFGLVFVTIFLVAAVVAGPVPEKDEDWQLIPDTEGALHLVDVKRAIAEDIEPAFNARQQVRFLLFTRSNPLVGREVQINNAAQLSQSPFNHAHPARFLIHGWNADENARVNTFNTAAYLSRGNFNVFVVDWSAGAMTANYIAARNRVDEVGALVGEYVDFINLHGVPFSQVTVSGHSLGGQVAGIAGKRVRRGRLASIVALDPALPLFPFDNPAGRVHYTDAVYVEIIHTDIGRLGFDVPIGHASFYPNWGRLMPGCGADLVGTCSHSLAWEFFAESIRVPGSFYGTRCSGWPAIQARHCPSTGPSRSMGGEPANNGANGVYFLVTNPQAPFGQGWRP